jgi:hypothetical protein
LVHFGYYPVVVYPKPSKGPLFDGLVKQLNTLHVPVVTSIEEAKAKLAEANISEEENESKS